MCMGKYNTNEKRTPTSDSQNVHHEISVGGGHLVRDLHLMLYRKVVHGLGTI